MVTILAIDDHPDILELLEILLTGEGYRFIGLTSSENIFQVLEKESPSLLIVDRGLPCIEGTLLVQKLRDRGYPVPVIFLTAKNSQEDKIEGFVRGGDDYITKPFDNHELLLRIRAILNRTNPKSNRILRYRDITMDLDSFEVYIGSDEVELTKVEFRLLQTFLERPKYVLTREYLLEVVWDCGIFNDDCNEKSVNVAIKRLKSKIDKDGTKHYIQAVRGVGYKLK